MRVNMKEKPTTPIFLRVQRPGASRVLALTDFLPEPWQLVSVSALDWDESSRTLKISKVV